MMKLCKCGCGYPTNQRNGYVRLHTPKKGLPCPFCGDSGCPGGCRTGK